MWQHEPREGQDGVDGGWWVAGDKRRAAAVIIVARRFVWCESSRGKKNCWHNEKVKKVKVPVGTVHTVGYSGT